MNFLAFLPLLFALLTASLIKPSTTSPDSLANTAIVACSDVGHVIASSLLPLLSRFHPGNRLAVGGHGSICDGQFVWLVVFSESRMSRDQSSVAAGMNVYPVLGGDGGMAERPEFFVQYDADFADGLGWEQDRAVVGEQGFRLVNAEIKVLPAGL